MSRTTPAVSSSNIVAPIFEQARLHPASPAIVTAERIITYGQLHVAVGALAAHLRRGGVAAGQVVAVSMGQNPAHVATLLALAQLGAVSLPLHVAVPAERRALAAQRFGASCVVSGRDDMALPGLPFVSLAGLSFDGAATMPGTEIFPARDDTPFRLAVSSGTSGDPKAVMLTHGLAARRIEPDEVGFTARSRVLPMDLNFIVGFRAVFSTLARGAALVMPSAMTPAGLLQALVSHAVTHVFLSPAQARAMTAELATDGVRCPDLVCLRIGGGPLADDILREVRAKLTPNVHVVYGSTESGVVTDAGPDLLARQPRSVGRVCAWACVEAVDENEHPLAPGGVGRLRVRSTQQAAGYHRDEERSGRHFRDGWFYSGDLGGFDEEGLLYIEGRADEQLNIGGLKVNPEDIDAALAAHADVLEAGAFVLAGEEGDERLAAALVLRGAATLDGIRTHARGKLGPLAPTDYFAVPALPRTVTGKLRRGELAVRFSSPDRSS